MEIPQDAHSLEVFSIKNNEAFIGYKLLNNNFHYIQVPYTDPFSIANMKKLIHLRTKLEFYKKLDKKLTKVLNAELEIEDWSDEVYEKINKLERELENLKTDMDLPDELWNEDETK